MAGPLDALHQPLNRTAALAAYAFAIAARGEGREGRSSDKGSSGGSGSGDNDGNGNWVSEEDGGDGVVTVLNAADGDARPIAITRALLQWLQ